ncbi:glycosyltransferase family 39 protein [bacterium]|nr:glycosyltransferase family 39 protein [bacterium]
MENYNKKFQYIEAFLLLILATGLVLPALTNHHLTFLNYIHASDMWHRHSAVLQALMGIYGSVAAIAGIVSFISIQRHGKMLCCQSFSWTQSIITEARKTWQWIYSTTELKQNFTWLGLLIFSGIVVRIFFIQQPMRYDESYTFNAFINGSISTLFYYPVPNNQVLHTLLARLCIELLGNEPWIIRLPAMLFGILNIPATFCMVRIITRENKFGYVAAALMAVFPYIVLYDTMARGYSIFIFLTLILAILCLKLVQRSSIPLFFLISLVTALGLWNIPIFLFPASSILGWTFILLLHKKHSPRAIFTHMAIQIAVMTAGLTALFYTPVILINNGTHTLTGNEFVKSLTLIGFFSRLPEHIMWTATRFLRDIPVVIIPVVSCFIFLGFYIMKCRKHVEALLLLPSAIIGIIVILLAKRVIPFHRTWIYLLPIIFLYFDAGLLNYLPKGGGKIKQYLILAITVVLGFILIKRDLISSYPDTGIYPAGRTFAETMAGQLNTGDKVLVRNPAGAPLFYYLTLCGIPLTIESTEGAAVYFIVGKHDNHSTEERVSISKIYYVVKPSRYTLEDLTDINARKLQTIDDAELYIHEFH